MWTKGVGVNSLESLDDGELRTVGIRGFWGSKVGDLKTRVPRVGFGGR